MVELRALVRERGLWHYSRLRKADLIAFLWDNFNPDPHLLLHNRLGFDLDLQNLRDLSPPPEGSFGPYELE